MFLSKRFIFIVLCAVVGVILLGSAVAVAQPRVFVRFNLTPSIYVSIPRSPQITLSVDRGEGATYYAGDPITVRYRTTSGGYVNLIQYQTDGGVSVLVRDQFVTQGSTQVYNGTVYGPAGTERMIILFTPDVVSDARLEEFIREPHQGSRIFRNFAVNRTHYTVASRVSSTSLSLDPVTFNIDPDGSIILTATLRDETGMPLQGKELVWSARPGSMSSRTTVTSPQGQSRNTFYAPTDGPATATITVTFQGDRNFNESTARSTAQVRAPFRPSSLTIEPSTFTVTSGERVRLVGILRDGAGNPVYGRTIFWSASRGEFDRTSAITDSSGRVVVNYFAPTVRSAIEVDITAEFRGAPGLPPTSRNIYGTVEPERIRPPATTTFTLDFGSGSPVHNVSNFRYSGRVVTGYASSGVSTLEMGQGDTLEFTFDPRGFPERAALFIWVQGHPRGRLEVRLNNRRVGSLTPVSGTLGPDDEKKITLTSADLIDGNNRLLLEVDGPRGDVLRLQRVIVVF